MIVLTRFSRAFSGFGRVSGPGSGLLAGLAAAFMAAVLAVGPAAADVYRVENIAVDETGDTARDAQTKARATAYVLAAQKLIARLTLPQDLAGATQPVNAGDFARMYLSTETMGETKSTANRYIATYAINFDPVAVRKYFEARDVAYVDSQAGKALIIPVGSANLDPVAWGQAWAGKSDNTSLTPFVASSYPLDRRPIWQEVAGEVSAAGARRAILALAYLQNGQIYVRLSEVRPSGEEAEIAITGPFSSFEQAQAGSIAQLEHAWKTESVVRTSGSTSMAMVARFNSISDWVLIRKALETSRLVKNTQVESLSTRGADLSLVIAGRPDQLAADLRSRGLSLGTDGGNYIVQAAIAPQ
ncbi:MAG: hypothetical protein R3C52_01925 [Hyphomonadaceae bacterium]